MSFLRRNGIALVALVFAMSGTGLAASRYVISSTSQISPSVRNALKGAQGPEGKQGPVIAGAPGLNGTNGKDGATGRMGPEGPQGPQGIKGDQGPQGEVSIEHVHHEAERTAEQMKFEGRLYDITEAEVEELRKAGLIK